FSELERTRGSFGAFERAFENCSGKCSDPWSTLPHRAASCRNLRQIRKYSGYRSLAPKSRRIRRLQKWLENDSGSAYRGSNPWGAANVFLTAVAAWHEN